MDRDGMFSSTAQLKTSQDISEIRVGLFPDSSSTVYKKYQEIKQMSVGHNGMTFKPKEPKCWFPRISEIRLKGCRHDNVNKIGHTHRK